MKTLKQLIKLNKLDWANPNINNENFPYNGRLSKEIKLFHFNRIISSEDAIKEMAKEGYEPANIYELLTWAKDNWNGKDVIVALGSAWHNLNGDRNFPFLRFVGSERDLDLSWFDDGWRAHCRFAAVKKAESKLPDTLEINGIKYKRLD